MAERKTRKQGDESDDSGTQTQAQGTTQAKAKPTGVSGPGTGAAPPEDEQERMPSTTVLATEAGPLVPSDVQKVEKPGQGHVDSSTDAVGANAAQRSVPGTSHVKVVDEDDNEIAVDDLFTAKDPADPSVFVHTRRRVYQIFTYPGARTQTRQLLYPQGARVTVFEAERVKNALREGAQDPAESMRPEPAGPNPARQEQGGQGEANAARGGGDAA